MMKKDELFLMFTLKFAINSIKNWALTFNSFVARFFGNFSFLGQSIFALLLVTAWIFLLNLAFGSYLLLFMLFFSFKEVSFLLLPLKFRLIITELIYLPKIHLGSLLNNVWLRYIIGLLFAIWLFFLLIFRLFYFLHLNARINNIFLAFKVWRLL